MRPIPEGRAVGSHRPWMSVTRMALRHAENDSVLAWTASVTAFFELKWPLGPVHRETRAGRGIRPSRPGTQTMAEIRRAIARRRFVWNFPRCLALWGCLLGNEFGARAALLRGWLRSLGTPRFLVKRQNRKACTGTARR